MNGKITLYLSWVLALTATLSSLFLSEVAQFTPCILCWYQRILIYPLTIIIGVGILKKDTGIFLYVLPFSILGMILALYHTALQMGIISESLAPCVAGISCTTRFINWFGFITIPFLSFVAFSGITVCMLLYRKSKKHL